MAQNSPEADTPAALNVSLTLGLGQSMRERVLRDDGYRRAIYEAAQSAQRHGRTETAKRLRSYLDVKLVER